MIFQWYLFVLLFVLATMSLVLGFAWEENYYGEKIVHYSWIPALVILVPMIYLATTRTSAFGDTSAYMGMFRDFSSSLSDITKTIMNNESKDRGFIVFSIIIKHIFGNNVKIFFLIIASTCLVSVVYGYKNYSCNFVMSMFLFIASGDYVQWCYNGIREFIAASILFAAMGFIIKKRYVAFILLVLLLSTIHMSALIMIPVVFVVQGEAWNKRTLLFIVVIILAVVFLEKTSNIITTIMENTQYSNEVGQYLETSGTSVPRVLVYSIPAVLSLFKLDVIKQKDNPIINLSIGMSIATMGFYIVSVFTSGIFIGRIPIFFSLYNYILLPWEISNIFEERSAKIVNIFIVILYMIYYYYQIHITWGL